MTIYEFIRRLTTNIFETIFIFSSILIQYKFLDLKKPWNASWIENV
jgi:hypothetical protein